MDRLTTLKDFLEHSCGMAPPPLINYYDPHREWIENKLAEYKSLNDSTYDEYVENLWIVLPELPEWFYYTGRDHS